MVETKSDTEPDLGPTEEAPYGYLIDPDTGEKRPKKKAGRPRRTVSTTAPDLGESTPTPLVRDPDVAPGTGTTRGRGRNTKKETEPELPPFRAGPIAKGMNRLYLKAGKLLRILDPAIGEAIISITRKEGDDDVTVGEAWEELAKTNPRVRAFLLKLITGSAWGSLFMAHAPIFLAILMKDGIRQKVPFMKVAEAFLDNEDNDSGPFGATEDPLGGLSPQDAAQMMGFAQGLMQQMGMNLPREDINDVREVG